MNDFDGLSVLVTGAGSGIGAATAALLVSRGAQVAALDRDVTGVPDGTLALACELGDAVQVDAALERIRAEFGGLDVVVNNAGIGAVGDITANDDAEWARVLDVNVLGMVRISRAALPLLRRSEHAVIVNTCSAVAVVGVRQRALYSASKGAVLALTLAMAADHAADGIRVNAVAPGTTRTAWVDRLLAASDDPDEAAEALRKRQPLGRLVTADEVAWTIASVASPRAGSTTGSIIGVDGGMTNVRI